MAELEEEYARAMDALSMLISSSRRRTDGVNWANGYEMMASYLEHLGLKEELGKLNVIHVAGTKGKGSTCAMVESMLRTAGYRTGLYTSPHLVDVRERIRINGEPVDKACFLRNLWACYHTLKEKTEDEGASMAAYFRFLTLLGFKIFLEQGVDVVVLEVGIGGRLDATNCVRQPVVCGVTPLGYDHMDLLGHTLSLIATEKAGIFKPGVPAFTVPQPKDALAALRHKADQVGAPLRVARAWESYSNAASVTPGLAGEHQKVNAALALQLAAEWEARCPVAAAVQGEAAARRADSVAMGLIPEDYVAGLERASWPGRGQIIHDRTAAADPSSNSSTSSNRLPSTNGAATAARTAEADPVVPRLSFFLDGAHTAESMVVAGQWFADASSKEERRGAIGSSDGLFTQRVLLFNCMQEREPQKLLQPLAQILAERQVAMQHALFVPPDSQYSKVGGGGSASEPAPVDLSWQHSLRGVWETLASRRAARQLPAGLSLPALPSLPVLSTTDASQGAVLPSLRMTLDWLRRCVRDVPTLRMHVLVTGSLYLVGDTLKLLNSNSGEGAPSGASSDAPCGTQPSSAREKSNMQT